jgi:uncharacterized protein YkwD
MVSTLKKYRPFLLYGLLLPITIAFLPTRGYSTNKGAVGFPFSDGAAQYNWASGNPLPIWMASSYPTDPTADIPWSCGFSGRDSIACAFNNARTTENTQLGTTLPALTLPIQAEWDAMGEAEKALWLINQERSDRGIDPLEQIEANVTAVAQTYADFLLENDAWGHSEDGRSPWDRLHDNPDIGACYDFLSVAENLAVFGSTGIIELPVERSVYMWMYDDAGSNWGHRHALLWYPYNDNSGLPEMEGFLGIGRASGGPYQGPFDREWPFAEMIVMNVFDPCDTWEYNSTTTTFPSSSTTTSPASSSTTTSMTLTTSTSSHSTSTILPPTITTTSSTPSHSTTTPATSTSTSGCSIEIEPQSEQVVSKQSLTFTVLPHGDCNDADYEWSLESTIGSSCDHYGNYTAGINPDRLNPVADTIRVVDHANDGITAGASVTVLFRCPSQYLYGASSEEVLLLRWFRDHVLCTTPEGKQIIKLYYQWSPLLLKAMEEDDALQEEVKEIVDHLVELLRADMKTIMRLESDR